jgi:hypothetical protein
MTYQTRHRPTHISTNLIELRLHLIGIDIALHWNYNISMALSDDNVFYVWGEFYKENFLTQTETMFKSFNEIFAHYFEQNFEVSEGIIEFIDFYFRKGFYERLVNEIEKLGEGSFGQMFKVSYKYNPEDLFAIKKIPLKGFKKQKEKTIEILREI